MGITTEKLLKAYDGLTKNDLRYENERALFRLLNGFKKEITGLIEADPSGFWFHKAFRQTDVTGNGDIDMAIWHLLQKASLFWQILKDPEDFNEFY